MTHHSAPATRWQALSIDLLNDLFAPLSFEERISALYRYFQPEEVLVTTSFGTKSVFLLYLLHRLRPDQRIYFINTTYHFPETLRYKEELIRRYDLQVEELRPQAEENQLTREEEWWKHHPRMCCAINKVAPLDPVKARHRIWISSLMAYQTDFRSRLRIVEQQGDILKFHPFIDMDEGEFLYYLSYHQLPRHPLEAEGFGSVGCTHCTKPGKGRAGRWQATGQTECGLHPGYFVKKRADK